MKKVGLTGNIGSGKSVISKIFDILGVPVYNADTRAKTILDTPSVINKVVNAFGKNIVDINGKINRKKLASIVFTSKTQLDLLNSFIHPAVIDDFKNWVNKNSSSPYVIMEAAILFETGYYNFFDKIIVVTSTADIRIERVMKRDNISEESVRIRMQNQKSESEIIGNAHFEIVNDNKCLVIPQVLKIHEALRTT
jgi:dephospho-CoA kinase